MLGAIIGDIVGSRFEFNNIKTKKFRLFDHKCSITDDSVMSVAVADMCLKGYVPNDKDKIISTFKMWGKRYPNAGYGGQFYNWVLGDNVRPYNSCGNGAAMRISAIGFFAKNEKEVEEYSKAVTEVTHNHEEGIKGAYVTAMCIYMARMGKTKQEIKTFVEQYYSLDFDYEKLRKTYYHGAEICQITVPQAIFCFLISHDFEDCLRTTISIGGDCDTTSAISCAVAEAYYGIPEYIKEGVQDFIPNDMKEVLDEFEKLCVSNSTKYHKIIPYLNLLKEFDKILDKYILLPIAFTILEPFFYIKEEKIFKDEGIEYSYEAIKNSEIEEFSEELVLACLTPIIKYERLHEGLFKKSIVDHTFERLLKRLLSFDYPLTNEDAILALQFRFDSFSNKYKSIFMKIDASNTEQVEIEHNYNLNGKKKERSLILNSKDSLELINKLNELDIINWEERYEPEGIVILDGDSWNVEIITKNLGRVRKSGSNAYPTQWKKFEMFIMWVLNNVMK